MTFRFDQPGSIVFWSNDLNFISGQFTFSNSFSLFGTSFLQSVHADQEIESRPFLTFLGCVYTCLNILRSGENSTNMQRRHDKKLKMKFISKFLIFEDVFELLDNR